MFTAAQSKLPPGDDVVFRRLFDEDNGCHLLICLLNAILGYPAGQRIAKLTLLRNHVTGALAEDKEVVLDIRAEAEDGRRFHIEVQVASQPSYSERILFYWAGIYAGQLGAGQGYKDLRGVVSVHILFFTLLKDPRHAAYHHVFRLRADQDEAILSPQLELHTVEMTKFPDQHEGLPGEKWLYWLKYGHEMTEQEVAQLGVPELIEAERKLTMISQDREVRVDYERRRMAYHDAIALRRDSWLEGIDEGKRQGIDEGKRQGIDEGKRQGIDEGKRQGIDEGKRQGVDEGKRLGAQFALVNAVVAVLAARGLALAAAQRVCLEAETDLTRLEQWIARAAVVSAVEELLNG